MVSSGALSLKTWSLPPRQPFQKRHQGSGNSSTRWAPRSKLCSTIQTSTSPPPQASMVANPEAGLGWNWSLGKTASFSGLKAVPHVIPHRSTRLGVQAQAKDSLPSRFTHAHTHRRQTTGSFLQPMAQLAIPSMAALNSRSTRTVSTWRVQALPGTNIAATDQSSNIETMGP